MKQEFKKLYLNNIFIAFILLCVVVVFTCGIVYNNVCKQNEIDNYSNLEYYENSQELEQIIEIKKNQLSSVNASYEQGKILTENYLNQVGQLNKELSYYSFMIENNLSYGEAIENITATTSNKYFFISNMVPYLVLFFVAFVIPLLCFFIYNYEMSSGVYRFVYIGQNRFRLILKKYFVYLFTVTSLFVILISLIILMSIPLDCPFKFILSYIEGKVYSHNVSSFIIYEILSALIQILIISTIFFSIAIHIKNNLLLVFLDAFIIVTVTVSSNFKNLATIFMQSITKVEYFDGTYTVWIVDTILFTLFSITLLVGSMWLFKQKELS